MDNVNHNIENRLSDLIDKQFLGTVEDSNDPNKEGRCRIRVFGIHGDALPVDDLPWAYPKNKSLFFGKNGKAGAISIPKTGSVVSVRFDNGNIYSPEYYSIQELADDIKEELEKDGEYQGSHFLLFDGDEELKLWFTVDKGLTIQLKEASINIGQDQVITIKTNSKVVVDSQNIELGADAIESVIKGDSLKTFFDSHVHPSSGAPPVLPLPPALLSKTSKTK
jgi:hypothetical protein